MADPLMLSRRTLMLHGSIGLPMAVVGYPLAIFLPPFYADELGLGLLAIGLALFLARLTDIVTDPLIAIVSDRLETPWGRRKPLMLLGLPLMTGGLFQLFMPPAEVGFTYLLAWMLIMYLGWTLIALPYAAWGAELSPAYHQRSRVTAAREGYILAGLLLGAAVPAFIQGSLPIGLTDSSSWLARLQDQEGNAPILEAMAWLVALTLPTTVLAVLVLIPEPSPLIRRQRHSWAAALRRIARNGPFKRVLLAILIVVTGEAFRNALSVFFMTNVIGIPDRIGLMYLLYFGTAVAAIPFWLYLGKRLGKHLAFCAAMSAVILCTFPMVFLGPGDQLAFAVMFAIKGFCFGAFQFLPLAMLADIADIDVARSSEPSTGLYFGLAGMAQKASFALGIVLSLGLLDLAGFQADGENTEGALLALRLCYVIVPISCFMAAFSLAWHYPLTAGRQAKLWARIERRDQRQRRYPRPSPADNEPSVTPRSTT